MTLRIIRCTPRHLDRMLAYVATHNPAGEHHVGYFGITPEDIRQTVLLLNLRYDRGFRLALMGGDITGVMGVDFDRQIGRAWLYGPIVTGDDGHRAATADALYAAVGKAIPAGVHEEEMFIDARNADGRAFADRHGFGLYKRPAIYTLAPDRLAALPEATAEAWDDRFAASFVALHEALFPRSNYTLRYMLDETARGATLLLLTDGDRPAGYFFGRAEQETGEAYVDLLGVDAAYRGQGLGRRLMLAGLARLRQTPGLRRVNLSVDGGNDPAMRLYESLGFEMEREMVAYRRNRA